MNQNICIWAGIRHDALKLSLKGLGNAYFRVSMPFYFAKPDKEFAKPDSAKWQEARKFLRTEVARRDNELKSYSELIAESLIPISKLMKKLPNSTRFDIVKELVPEAELVRRGGYYRGLCISASPENRSTLRMLGFDTSLVMG